MPDSRLLSITTPLGPGELVATQLAVNEPIGLPYSIDVEVLGRDATLQAEALLTKPITVTVSLSVQGSVVRRHFHGLVAEFHRLGLGQADRSRYRLVAVPAIWQLGLRQNCRIFQGKTVQAVVNAILAEHGQPAPSWGMLPELEPMDYCTQFNETDLHFVSRLLEEHGLGYAFTHGASSHTLRICATSQGFPLFEGGSVQAMHGSVGPASLLGWRRTNRARSASAMLRDMDRERSQPSVVQQRDSKTRRYAAEPQMWQAGEWNHWPGGMSTRPGVDSAAVAMGAQEAASEAFGAESIDPRFTAGVRVQVAVRAEGGGAASSQQYLVTGVWHMASDVSGLIAGGGDAESYNSTLALVATDRDWMPQRQHARPNMPGLHSAQVTGPSGEKIHVDKFGRVKVKFRWDRLARNDGTSSCWVRVAQAAAGAWGGTWFLPRVGDEVLVAFLDGDPDRPIVTGSVYGKDAVPPFEPGEHKARSGIRTRSYKSENTNDANILRFDDTKGSEEVLLHAERDLQVEVERNETRQVGNDQTETIKNARKVTIQDADDSLTLDKGNQTTTVKLGNLTVKCDAGSITMEAKQSITLKVGQSSVVIDQSGITLKGMTITEEAQMLHKTKGTMIQEEAGAIVQVKGTLITLN